MYSVVQILWIKLLKIHLDYDALKILSIILVNFIKQIKNNIMD